MRISGERGQGVLEYILVLVVIVLIATGVMFQFHKGFRVFLTAQFDYVECLLETGELPYPVGDPNSDCGSFSPFGDLSKADGGGPGGRGSGDRDGRGSGKDSKDGSTDQSGGGSSSSSSSSSASAGFLGGRQGSGRPESAPATESEAEAAAAYTGSTEISSGSRRANAGVLAKSDGRERVERDYDLSDEEREKAKKKKNPKTEVGQASSDGLRKKREPVSEKKKAAVVAESEEGFSFGNILRIFIIILVIIGILVFVGGQGMQIAKNWE